MGRNLEAEIVGMPRWLAIIVLGAVIGLFGTGVTTWARANSNSDDIERHEKRIERLENDISKLNERMAAVNQNVKDMKEVQDANSGKLDRILELEMSHR